MKKQATIPNNKKKEKKRIRPTLLQKEKYLHYKSTTKVTVKGIIQTTSPSEA